MASTLRAPGRAATRGGCAFARTAIWCGGSTPRVTATTGRATMVRGT
jgi:hypothetical protein